MPRPIEDESGYFQQLLVIGKERGYLLYDEINDSLPADVLSSQEIDDLLALLERQGIEIQEEPGAANAVRATTAVDAPEAGQKEEFAVQATDVAAGDSRAKTIVNSRASRVNPAGSSHLSLAPSNRTCKKEAR